MENHLVSEYIGINNFTASVLIKNAKRHTSTYLPTSSLSPVFGIEVEAENVRDFTEKKGWAPKEDNSLRNFGIEYVSLPLPYYAIEESLNILFGEILPEDVVFSRRTSIHVHINALDFSQVEIYKFIIIYCIFERCLYKFVDKERKRNIFCVPLYKTKEGGLIKKARNSHFVTNNWYKYLGLNLRSLSQYGTIEFRHLQGTNNIELIKNWIELIASIYTYTRSCSEEELFSKVLTLNTSSQYYQFLSSVFPTCPSLLTIDKGYVQDMEKGISFVKSDIFINPFEKFIFEKLSRTSKLYLNMFPPKQNKKSSFNLSPPSSLESAFSEAVAPIQF